MTFAAILALLKEVDWRKLLPQIALGVLVIGLVTGLVVSRIQLNSARHAVEKAEMARDLAIWNYDLCEENRETLETALEENNQQMIQLGEMAQSLNGQLVVVSLQAAGLAARNDELGNIEEKYHQLFERAKELPVCTTYEWSLRLITGEELPE